MSKLLPILRKRLQEAGDPERAAGQQAYMKSSMPFHGVTSGQMRAIGKEVFDARRIGSAEEWRGEALSMWRGAQFREERYAAIALTGHRDYAEFQTLDVLPMYEEMIVTGAWWDFVDSVAPHRVGEILLRRYPAKVKRIMRAWSRDDDMWKRRSSIICQLTFKRETDLDLLYACIEPSLPSSEFFLRKAIGWALRQYAWTDPDEIRRYVAANRQRLSPLSVR
ncbi:MAG: DNA alkylation repair protein, partial [Thermoanaerobaculia bacterium]